jgi:hypothetical protein
MALIITDPTTLITGGDAGTAFAAPLSLDTGAKTFTITPGSGVLPDAADGVTGQALYSAFKILWKNNSTYIKFPFPMEAITPEQFEFINGWAPADDVTRKALRTCGWVERNAGGSILKMYAGIVSLGSLGTSDQPYYQQISTTTAPVNFTFLGPVNEAVKILEDPNGDGSYVDGFDRRTYMKLFAREYQKTYASAQLSDIGVTSMTYIVYRFPLANADDSLKITHNDVAVAASPYTKITITWVRDASNSYAVYNVRGDMAGSTAYVISDVVKDTGNNRWYKCILGYTSAGSPTQPSGDATHWSAYEGERQLGSSYYPFTVIIDADNTVAASASGSQRTTEIYERIQYQLRQSSDIDAGANGAVTGKTADSLLRFVGDTLVTSNGVYIESLNSNDINTVEFYDSTGTKRTFPFVAAGTLVFNNNLVNDASAIYRMYFTTLPGATNDFGESGAVLVQDSLGVDISGTVGGLSSKSWSFAYDSNVQGGRSAGTDAAVTIVAIGLSTGQYVSTTATITRTTGQNISLVSSLERNYSNA